MKNPRPMENYALTIICEFLNEAGILVNHTLKTIAHTQPRIADKYMFVASQHFKPIVIRILNVAGGSGNGVPGIDLVCEGEEVDDTEDIKETFHHSNFVIL